MQAIIIPPFLDHLKVDARGYPIPFFVPYIDGKPDFRFVTAEKIHLCVEKKLCGICGKKLFEFSYFCTGPVGLQSGSHSDPPAHKQCLEYALKTCPHLVFEKTTRNERGELYKELREQDFVGIETKPKEFYLIKADKFKLVTLPHGQDILTFRKVSWEKYTYQDGTLQKEMVNG